jgi:hypothetical protein
MDKEQARFILRSFRPDGADANDPDFAEALKLAMENRELGEWLASERAFDAEFAQALSSVKLAENLREDILACLAAERGDFPQAEDENDAAWIGAIATIQPPAELRASILAAMDRTVATDINPAIAQRKISIFRRLAIPLAAAAGITIAFMVTRPTTPTTVAQDSRVPMNVVLTSFANEYEAPDFSLDKLSPNRALLVQHLREQDLPYCESLPPGLTEAICLGCRELVIDGKRGSVVCFKTTSGGVVHMIVFRREDVSGDFPEMKSAVTTRTGTWESKGWTQGDKVILLASNTKGLDLSTLF